MNYTYYVCPICDARNEVDYSVLKLSVNHCKKCGSLLSNNKEFCKVVKYKNDRASAYKEIKTCNDVAKIAIDEKIESKIESNNARESSVKSNNEFPTFDNKEALKYYLSCVIDIELYIQTIGESLKRYSVLKEAYRYSKNDVVKEADRNYEDLLYDYEKKLNNLTNKINKLSEPPEITDAELEKKGIVCPESVLMPIRPLEPECPETLSFPAINKPIIPSKLEYGVETELVEPMPPMLVQPRFFSKKKDMERNRLLQEKYDSDSAEYSRYMQRLNSYDNAMKRYENDLNNYNHQIEQRLMYEKSLKEYDIKIAEYRKAMAEYETESEKYNQYHIAKNIFDNKKKEYTLEKKRVNQSKIEKYKQEAARINSILQNANDHAKEIKAAILQRNPFVIMSGFIDQEIALLNSKLKEALKWRQQIYDVGIIYKKYRNIVAVTSFYEYFDSGRCDALEGSTGAYNIFEQEIRASMIISKLSDAVSVLKDIRENQNRLYDAINEMNSQIKIMNTNLIRISAELSDISYEISSLDMVVDSLNKIENHSKVSAIANVVTATASTLKLLESL